jgi:plastocyanin
MNLFNGPSGEQPTIDPNYGQVLGYFSSSGTLNVQSQVVTVPAGAVVTFKNFDLVGLQHTASFLGDATQNNAPWPSPFNGSGTQSPAGTIINTPMFSTGPIDGNKKSLKYLTPPPGFYMFGCFFHYDSNGMRTVIIAQ